MSDHSKKIESFRKEIRREQIHSMLAEKRIKMMEGHKQDQEDCMSIESEKEIMNVHDPGTLTLEELKKISKFAQSPHGIMVIHKAEYEHHLLKYLAQKYTNTEEQYYSSYILCNLYYKPQKEPSEQLTRELMRMMEEADMRTLENVFYLIGNAMIDYQNWFQLIMGESYKLGQKLLSLFRFQAPTTGYLNSVVSFIFRVIHKKGKYSSFLKLKQHLLKLIFQQEHEGVKKLIKNAVYCYYMLVILFPQEMAPAVIKFGVLKRLIKLWDFFFDRKMIKLTIEIVGATLHEITILEFQSLVVPYLVRLIERNFEVGENNSVIQPYQLKKVTYTLIKMALETGKLRIDFFSSLKVTEIMLDEFRISDDIQILCTLTYIFVPICLSSKDQVFNNEVRNMIQRAVAISKSFELAVFLQEFDRSSI